MALTALGHMWARSAEVAVDKVSGDNTGYYETKLTTARYFFERILPQVESLARTLRAGSDTIMALDAEAF